MEIPDCAIMRAQAEAEELAGIALGDLLAERPEITEHLRAWLAQHGPGLTRHDVTDLLFAWLIDGVVLAEETRSAAYRRLLADVEPAVGGNPYADERIESLLGYDKDYVVRWVEG